MADNFAVYDDGCSNWVIVSRSGFMPVMGVAVPKECGLGIGEALDALKRDEVPVDCCKIGTRDCIRLSARMDPVADFDGTGGFAVSGECEYVRAYQASL